MSEPRHRIIYDTDPGVDDSMAFFLAHTSPEIELLALTTIFGNGGIETTTANALRLVETVDRPDIPVLRGAAKPLLHAYDGRGAMVHGSDGLGDSHMPPASLQPANGQAAQFIAEQIMAAPGEITLVAVGPLTNLALAVSLEPGIADAVREVIIMGGAATVAGNASPVAEANIHNDAAAARIVFEAGWPLTMVGLDATQATIMSSAYLDDLYAIGNPATDFIARIVPFYHRFHTRQGVDGIYVHDSSAIMYAIDPTLYETRSAYVRVCLGHEGTRGQTIPDWRSQWRAEPACNVCLGVDAERLKAMYRERLIHGFA